MFAEQCQVILCGVIAHVCVVHHQRTVRVVYHTYAVSHQRVMLHDASFLHC
jgi:hypothetical protein